LALGSGQQVDVEVRRILSVRFGTVEVGFVELVANALRWIPAVRITRRPGVLPSEDR
jgi:hypothetical protein